MDQVEVSSGGNYLVLRAGHFVYVIALKPHTNPAR